MWFLSPSRFEGGEVIFGRDGRILLRHNGSLRSETLSDFCKEPSPKGRGGKMLKDAR
jgi:hypothetical protein